MTMLDAAARRETAARRTVVRALGPLLAATLSALSACGEGAGVRSSSAAPADARSGRPAPDQVPVMLNTELPFRYPAALYARKVQGNVTLRLYVDSVGRVRPESTHIAESSGY